MDHKVDFLRLLYRTHSENAAHVHNADTAQLYVMADQLRRAADERFRRHALDFDRVVRNEPVPAFDQFDSCLTLADAAVAQHQDTLAVHLDKHAVTCNALCKRNGKRADERRHKLTRRPCRPIERCFVLLRKLI